MKIYFGLLLLFVAALAQQSPKRGPGPSTAQDSGAIDYSADFNLVEPTQPPSRRPRPGTLRRRTKPAPSTQADKDDSEMVTDASAEFETTTLSEYATLTKNLKFDCSEQAPGFYANVDTGCRIWHYCFGAIRYDNICPALTLFDQELVTCVYASDTDCSKAPTFYDKNKLLYVTTPRPFKNSNPKTPGLRRRIRLRPTTIKPVDYSDFDSSQIPVAHQ